MVIIWVAKEGYEWTRCFCSTATDTRVLIAQCTEVKRELQLYKDKHGAWPRSLFDAGIWPISYFGIWRYRPSSLDFDGPMLEIGCSGWHIVGTSPDENGDCGAWD